MRGAGWVRALIQTPWFRPLNDIDALDDWLALMRPWWSLGRIRARIAAVRVESADTRTFVLAPNWRWPGFTAGQHVAIEVELDGVRHYRTFSLSSGPADRYLALTVKRAGRVTAAMHAQLRAGDAVTLTGPAGRFVLPDPLPHRLLLVAGGVGITPLLSILRDLAARGHRGSVVLVQVHRGAPLFGTEVHQLADALPGLVVHTHDTETEGRPGMAALVGWVQDPGGLQTFLCGPPGFMADLRAHPAAEGLAARMVVERFDRSPTSAPGRPGASVRAVRSARSFASTGGPLLEDAEAAGLSPRFGCRLGTCRSCVVLKVRGVVEDLRTGRTSDAPDEVIQLCVSGARSDLVLDL